MLHFSGGVGHVARQQIDRLDCLQHLLAPALCGVVGVLGGLGGSHRVARHFVYGCGHLIHGGSRLFDLVVLLVQAAGGVFGDRVELLGCRGKLIGRVGDALNGRAQIGLHGFQ